MKKMFSYDKYMIFTLHLMHSFIATGLSAYLALLSISTSTFFSYIINSFLIKIGIYIDPDKVTAAYPRKDYLNSILEEEDVKVLTLVYSLSKNKKVLLI